MSSDIGLIFDRFARHPDDATMSAVASAAAEADPDDLAQLTLALAGDGDRIDALSSETVDIASSGGPGSLSTLLAPLYARALGGRVAKISVAGRPAGGLDVLASLPGYRGDVGAAEARTILDACGYVHVGAGAAFCPLDVAFFSWRQANGAQAIPNLAIASLLSKKLAAGVGRVVLDVRVGHFGNFGETRHEARANARRFVAVAARLGITALCVVTEAPGAPQPWIGRGEALVALARIFDHSAQGDLEAHATTCLRMAKLAVGIEDPVSTAHIAEGAKRAHERMLNAHGVNPEAFWSRERAIQASPVRAISSAQSGSLRVDLAGIRRVLVERQAAATAAPGASFSDPAGVRLADGTVESDGAWLALVRDDDDPAKLAGRLREYLSVDEELTPDATEPQMEIVRE